MTKEEKHSLAKKIINFTDANADTEEFIHSLLEDTGAYKLYDDTELTLGEKMADKLASFAGSWAFVSFFSLTLIVWIVLNVWLLNHPFDPYPFILLNLVLSCVSAIQAPLIMMSQNRQENKDRKRSECEYKINIKSEIIAEDMHYKIDMIIAQQKEILSILKDK